jgi:alpha-galactosidase
MGWASWNHFFCEYDEQTIRQQADALVATGMKEAGYQYVIIQECIAPGRDEKGNLAPDAKRFPHGMKALADYIHGKGLKMGIYTDVGPNTCASNPKFQGSLNHEDQDAAQFAAWGVDLIWEDYCNKPSEFTGKQLYERMQNAILKTGRPMLLYVCSWGNASPWEWGGRVGQLWRTDQDISATRNRVRWEDILRNFDPNARRAVFSAPGSWNDADMLEVGNSGITVEEARSHFAMWAISSSPLWAGADRPGPQGARRRLRVGGVEQTVALSERRMARGVAAEPDPCRCENGRGVARFGIDARRFGGA